jgi:hypothetical protein
MVWTQTSQQSGVWNNPIYAQFFATVRAVNAALAPDRQFRVLLGDPAAAVDRDQVFANVVRRESLERGRRTLLVAGLFHAVRTGHDASVADLLEHDTPVFSVLPIGGSVADDTEIRTHLAGLAYPSKLRLADSWLGAQPEDLFHAGSTVTCDNPPCDDGGDARALAQMADAYLYLGP